MHIYVMQTIYCPPCGTEYQCGGVPVSLLSITARRHMQTSAPSCRASKPCSVGPRLLNNGFSFWVHNQDREEQHTSPGAWWSRLSCCERVQPTQASRDLIRATSSSPSGFGRWCRRLGSGDLPPVCAGLASASRWATFWRGLEGHSTYKSKQEKLASHPFQQS
jgi:hypothetical protein